jgi:sigma-B regulation protein RsbU (phosphoserine phosphatase)
MVPLQGHELAALRVEIAYIILGTLFVFFGFAALAIAAIRERREVLILVWLGIWSAMYGFNLLITRSPSLRQALPQILQGSIPFAKDAFGFLLLVAALLAWSELTVGRIRTFTQLMVFPSAALAVAGMGLLIAHRSADRLVSYNNLLAVVAAVVLTTVVLVPKLSARYMTYQSRVLAICALLFTLDALYTNVAGVLHRPTVAPFWGDLVFAAFLLAFAYVVARKVFASEQRLLSIEKELEIARQIQASILPTSVPEIDHLSIVASYHPMAAVGGDFYEFLPIDRNRAGFLVADVSGHGIPAALIASMIKIGVQSTVSCAADPGEVLRRLNQLLSGQLRGVLLSAAYLWVDTEGRTALYSAAGHPPLLRGRESGMERIESNGLLMGVFADSAYPVRQMDLRVGDRFLLCTDGVFESENAAGVAFGDCRLQEVIRDHEGRSAADLSAQLLCEIRRWQPPSTEQQDDITLMVIDVV